MKSSITWHTDGTQWTLAVGTTLTFAIILYSARRELTLEAGVSLRPSVSPTEFPCQPCGPSTRSWGQCRIRWMSQAGVTHGTSCVTSSPFQIFPSFPARQCCSKILPKKDLAWDGTGEEKGRGARASRVSHFVCEVMDLSQEDQRWRFSREHPRFSPALPQKTNHPTLAAPESSYRRLEATSLHARWGAHCFVPGAVSYSPLWSGSFMPRGFWLWIITQHWMEPKKRGKQGWNPRNVENKNDRKQQESQSPKENRPLVWAWERGLPLAPTGWQSLCSKYHPSQSQGATLGHWALGHQICFLTWDPTLINRHVYLPSALTNP